jgi:cytochrome P450
MSATPDLDAGNTGHTAGAGNTAGAASAGGVAGVGLDDPEFLRCPYPALAAARQAGGVVPAGRPGWFLVARAELVREVLRDTATYSSAVHKHSQPPAEVADEVAAIRARGWPYTPGLGTSDPPVHTRNRKLVNQTFTPRGLAWMEPLVADVAAELAAALPDGAGVDFVAAFAQPLPVWAISEILGLPAAHRADVVTWTRAATASIGARPAADRWVADELSLLELQKVLAAALERQRGDAAGRLIGRLAAAAEADPGQEISTALLLTMLRELLVAGNETTAKTIAQVVLLVDGREDVWERLRREPEHADAVAEEALRVTSPSLSAHRRATADTELGGVPIPAGSTLVLSLAAANGDPAVFTDPARFDPGRDARELRQHLAFGQGPHMCVGAGLARLELRIALRTLAGAVRRIDVVDPASVAYNESYMLRGLLALPVVVTRLAPGEGA